MSPEFFVCASVCVLSVFGAFAVELDWIWSDEFRVAMREDRLWDIERHGS